MITLRAGVELWHLLVGFVFVLVVAYMAILLVWGLTVRPIRFVEHYFRSRCWPVRSGYTGGFRCSCGRSSHNLSDFPGHRELTAVGRRPGGHTS